MALPNLKINQQQLDLALRRMIALGIPLDFLYLTLMASWVSDAYDLGENSLDVIEFFAGVSRICKLAAWYGYASRGFELNYDTPPKGVSKHSRMPKRSAFDFCGEAGFLLAVVLILQGQFGALFAFLAPVCSSYSAVNRASSGRSVLTPLGRTTSTSVRRGNLMVARTSLLIALVCCLDGCFALENPATSLILLHPRLHEVLWKLQSAGITVYKPVFKMKAFGSRTDKPTLLVTNSADIATLHGKRAKRTKTRRPLCRKYLDSKGRPAYCGTKWLKKSQKYPAQFARAIVEQLPHVRRRQRPAFKVNVNHTSPLLRVLASVECLTWPEAELFQILRYTRGIKGLKVPPNMSQVDTYLRDRIAYTANGGT